MRPRLHEEDVEHRADTDISDASTRTPLSALGTSSGSGLLLQRSPAAEDPQPWLLTCRSGLPQVGHRMRSPVPLPLLRVLQCARTRSNPDRKISSRLIVPVPTPSAPHPLLTPPRSQRQGRVHLPPGLEDVRLRRAGQERHLPGAGGRGGPLRRLGARMQGLCEGMMRPGLLLPVVLVCGRLSSAPLWFSRGHARCTSKVSGSRVSLRRTGAARCASPLSLTLLSFELVVRRHQHHDVVHPA